MVSSNLLKGKGSGKPEPYFLFYFSVAADISLQQKEVCPASASLEHFMVADELICKAEDCLLILHNVVG